MVISVKLSHIIYYICDIIVIISVANSSNFYMATFDAKSLFTNIPLDETIRIATDSLYSNPASAPAISCRFFTQLLELAVKGVLFLFNGKLFS